MSYTWTYLLCIHGHYLIQDRFGKDKIFLSIYFVFCSCYVFKTNGRICSFEKKKRVIYGGYKEAYTNALIECQKGLVDI